MKLQNLLGSLALWWAWLALEASCTLNPESVEISAAFPLENQFGRVFNGESNKIILKIVNMGKHPVEDVLRIHSVWNEFREVGGKERLLRKGHPTPSKRTVPPGSSAYTVPYYFNSEQKEGDVNLRVWVEWSGPTGKNFKSMAYDSTVTVQEPPTRWFDPQLIFLYLIFGSIVGTVGYMVFVTYLKAPEAGAKFGKSKSKPNSFPDHSSPSAPKVSTPSGKAYEEEWIPSGHPASSKKSTAESGEESTPKDEKPRRRKR